MDVPDVAAVENHHNQAGVKCEWITQVELARSAPAGKSQSIYTGLQLMILVVTNIPQHNMTVALEKREVFDKHHEMGTYSLISNSYTPYSNKSLSRRTDFEWCRFTLYFYKRLFSITNKTAKKNIKSI
ncbi:MAG: hypothetical protein WAM14_06885 [Candidatus Nitrosopolaris sp.]